VNPDGGGRFHWSGAEVGSRKETCCTAYRKSMMVRISKISFLTARWWMRICVLVDRLLDPVMRIRLVVSRRRSAVWNAWRRWDDTISDRSAKYRSKGMT